MLPWALVIGAWVWIAKRARGSIGIGGPLQSLLKGRPKRFERQDHVRVRFDDVAGLTNSKRDLQEVVEFLRTPERFQRLGGKLPRGVLLVGPPGTGKTLLARAVAGEAEVPFFYVNGSEFIQLFVGVGAVARARSVRRGEGGAVRRSSSSTRSTRSAGRAGRASAGATTSASRR